MDRTISKGAVSSAFGFGVGYPSACASWPARRRFRPCWYHHRVQTVVGSNAVKNPNDEASRAAPPVRPVSTVPPFSLLDEPVRVLLAGACEALAAAPRALYPVVFVGPLRSGELLRRAAADAGEAFGLPVAEWRSDLRASAPTFLICQVEDVEDARTWSKGREGVQLIAWSPRSKDELEPFMAPGDLVIDAGGLGLRGAAWLGGIVSQVIRDRFGPGNPVVVVGDSSGVGLRSLEVQMYLDAGGFQPVEIAAGSLNRRVMGTGIGFVAHHGPGADDDGRIVDLAVACRFEGSPLAILTSSTSWERLRTTREWVDRVGVSSVAWCDDGQSEPAFTGLPWPSIAAVWVGAIPECASHATASLILPPGTPLLEGLGHMEVRARPGRLIAWCRDRVGVIGVEQRTAGTVVTSALIVGRPACSDRESVLACLDSIRGWEGLQLAVVGANGGEAGTVEEPVQRVGFHFSRLDDERFLGAPLPEPAEAALGVYGVAKALAECGIAAAARALLRRVERESGWGVEEEMLLGYLVADSDPEESVTRLRHVAVRLANLEEDETGPGSWMLQTDATLNALLLLVRTRRVGAADAWETVDAWLSGAGTGWVSTPRHAAVLFELGFRAGRTRDARRFADLFRSLAGPEEPLAQALAPAFAHVFRGEAR